MTFGWLASLDTIRKIVVDIGHLSAQLGGSPIAEMTGPIYCDSAVVDNVGSDYSAPQPVEFSGQWLCHR
jgi:hypothetical protein